MRPYYEHGGITIYNGDCRELIGGIGKVDLVCTDPPFSATTHNNAKSNRGIKGGSKAIDFASIDFP